MPVLLQAGENLYLSAYDFGVVLQPIGTEFPFDTQELFLTVKNPPVQPACVRRGTTPARIKPANVEGPGGPGAHVRDGSTPRQILSGARGSGIRPGTSAPIIRPAAAGGGVSIKPGTSPTVVKPASVATRGPSVKLGTTPARIKPAKTGTRGPSIKPGTTARRIKPDGEEC